MAETHGRGPSLRDLLREGTALLREAGIEDAAQDAALLLGFATERNRLDLLTRADECPSAEAIGRYRALLSRRYRREPLSHLIGRRGFWKLEFAVSRDVLDPRPDTESLIEAALEIVPPPERILDLGTGSGCLLLSLLDEFPASFGIGIDISSKALAVAQDNAGALGLAARAAFVCGDWFGAVAGQFNLIVTNPPYIREDEAPLLQPELRDHEPPEALFGGADGLDAYRSILAGAPAHLAPGGTLLMEIGAGQAEDVMALARAAGFVSLARRRDLDGRDRCIIARLT